MALLRTKLHIPTAQRQLVPRPRITARMPVETGSLPRLVLVSAPAGFGKTTLMSQWLDQWRTGGQRTGSCWVAWLSLDAEDRDPRRFLTHVVGAIQATAPQVGVDAAALLQASGTEIPPGVLVSLINDLDSLDGRLVLAFDDYHLIESAEVHQAVAFLLDHLPPHLSLAMATRSDPPLPLARLRSRGQLHEVRAADLRFTPAEAQEFLNGAMGLDLAVSDVDALEDRTEGWAAGLQLAALSLRGIPERGDVAAFIQAFTGSNRFVIDYLVDEVLARQPVPVREFLLSTAVLDRLTGDLCDAVTGTTDGTRILESLERGNLFLVPLDTERSWYRYHHLFADTLRARLRAEAPDQVSGLHRRASEWFAGRGRTAAAVRHALAAEDFERAAYLVEKALPELRRTRQDDLLLTWVRALPETVVKRSPVLSITAAWSLLMSGDLDAAERRLGDAEAALATGAADKDASAAWVDTDELRTAPATVSVYRASLAQARGDVAGTVRHAHRALELAGPEDHLVRGAGSGFLGLAAWAAGDVREALSTFGEAVRCLRDAGNFVDALDGTIVLADMWGASGRPSRARRLCEQALGTATGGRHPHLRAAADLHVALAELDRELDDLAGAEGHLEAARTLGEGASITENRHRWFVAMSQLRAATGDYDTAASLLGQTEALYRPGFYPDLRPIAAMRARVHLAAGDLTPAGAWAEDRQVMVGEDPNYLREYEHLTLVRFLIARDRDEQRNDGARRHADLLGWLERLETEAGDAGRDGSTLEIRLLQALAHHAHGDLVAATNTLGRALGEASEPHGYVRLYLDEGSPLLELLHQAASATTSFSGVRDEEPVQRLARMLLDRAQPGRSSATPHPRTDTLSPRELDVLRLLDSELTGPEIARQLYITLNTLRTHTKRIFTKLDASTRTAAVHRARERGLL